MGAAPSKSKDLSLRNILIFVLYSGVLIIMFVLLAKRQIKRMRLRYDTNFETRQVMGFPKHYRNGSMRQLPTSLAFFIPDILDMHGRLPILLDRRTLLCGN